LVYCSSASTRLRGVASQRGLFNLATQYRRFEGYAAQVVSHLAQQNQGVWVGVDALQLAQGQTPPVLDAVQRAPELRRSLNSVDAHCVSV
jgi:hypothetical protein